MDISEFLQDICWKTCIRFAIVSAGALEMKDIVMVSVQLVEREP
jgi:hypothetical protein